MKDRTLLMIPGPIEVEPAVLAAHAAPTTSHLDPRFVEAFSRALVGLGGLFGSAGRQLLRRLVELPAHQEAYEARRPSYFGTPALNLVWADLDQVVLRQ